MSKHNLLLELRMPELWLEVVGSIASGELLFHDDEHSFRVTLRGRTWELFEVLLLAQLDSSQQHPHRGFRSVKEIARELSDQPLANDVIHRIDRLRHKIAKEKFGIGSPSDPSVAEFRNAVIETTGLGYRLSIPPENIEVSIAREVEDGH